MRKLLMLGAVASLVAVAQPGLAADMPVKAAPVAVAAPFSWSGIYLGVVGGWASADTRHINVNNGVNSGNNARIRGGLLGATYGVNWQISSFVIGFEGDISGTNFKRNFVSPGNFCPVGLPCETELRWFGTNRARLGYAWDRLLFYGTAGIAYGEVRGTLLFPGFVAGETTRTGFVYGGGLEVALSPGWSVKAEYLHTDFGDKLTYGNPVPVESVSFKRVNIVRGGLNYNFNWPRW